jgi:hypothetical protein
MLAGLIEVMDELAERQSLTALALRLSGHVQMILLAFIICLTDIVIAF